jgi:5-methylcytosine-specific restriction endonuclease McrA
MSDTVLVYNAGGQELLKRVDMHKAMRMLWRGVARILEADTGTFGEFEKPKSLELVRYIVTKWRYEATGKVPFGRLGILRRDKFTCAYCLKVGTRATMTVDHVLPKWKGNALSWNNGVAACQPCNNKKGGQSPKEAGMKLLITPYVPGFAEAYRLVHGKD